MIKYGVHKCYNCDEEYEWTLVTILEGYDKTPLHSIKGFRATAAYVEKNVLEINAECTKCHEVNRFRINKI